MIYHFKFTDYIFSMRLWLIAFFCIISPFCFADNVNVAVASNFFVPMKKLATEFEQLSSHQVRLTSGSSGKIYAQILNGAPFHLFLSADQIKPAHLKKQGLIAKDCRFTYAIGSLVLWSYKADLKTDAFERLQTGNFNKLAIANPKIAPYGQATKDVLRAIGVYSKVKDKLIFGENVAQTFQFVMTGNADMGFIAQSQLKHNQQMKVGSTWVVPQSLYQPVFQDVVLLKIAKENKAANALFEFLRSARARKIIEAYGYQTALGD